MGHGEEHMHPVHTCMPGNQPPLAELLMRPEVYCPLLCSSRGMAAVRRKSMLQILVLSRQIIYCETAAGWIGWRDTLAGK